MTAAPLTRTPAGHVDRLVLRTGLALVDWSSRRVARRARLAALPGSSASEVRDGREAARLARARSDALVARDGLRTTLFR